MKNYSVDYVANTITITHLFAKRMQNPNSSEYVLIQQILADFPKMRIVRRTHKKPTKYHNNNGETTSKNQFKNLSYENMERFMKSIPNNEKYLNEYEFLRDVATGLQINGYATVRKWFVAQFPKFRNNPLFYIANDVDAVSAVEFIKESENIKEAA